MTGIDHSYLEGQEWTLRTRVQRKDTHEITLTHDAAIRATHDTRPKWNEQFWLLFPSDPAQLRGAVVRGEVTVTIMYRFAPTIRMKDTYNGHPVLKIARGDAHSEDYDRDKRRLEEQRRQAWLELTSLRLPSPPYGYEWELLNGDPRSYSDVLNFRLKMK